MKKTVLLLSLSLATAALAFPSGGPPPPPPTPPPEPPPLVSASNASGRLTVVGATTAPTNATFLEVGFGWPGLHAGVVRGFTDQLQLGARFSFNFGVEGMMNGVVPGLKLQFLVHFKIWENNKFSLGVRFEPGPMVYFYTSASINNCFFDQFGNVVCGRNTSATAGLAMPLGVRLGIIASPAVAVGVSFDIPLWLQFGTTTSLQVPILMGLGVEYFLQSNLLLAVTLKMGPTLSSIGNQAVFTFEGKLGGAYRF